MTECMVCMCMSVKEPAPYRRRKRVRAGFTQNNVRHETQGLQAVNSQMCNGGHQRRKSGSQRAAAAISTNITPCKLKSEINQDCREQTHTTQNLCTTPSFHTVWTHKALRMSKFRKATLQKPQIGDN